MKITSNQLIAIDRFMDRSLIFSPINNFVNLVLKAILKFQSPSERDKPLTNYWTYIAQKDMWTCGLGLVPVVGRGLIKCKDLVDKRHAKADFLKIKNELGIAEDGLETVSESDVIEEVHKLSPYRQAHIWKSEAFIHFIQNDIESDLGPESLIHDIPVEQLYKMGQLSFCELVTDEEVTDPSFKKASFAVKALAVGLAAHSIMGKSK